MESALSFMSTVSRALQSIDKPSSRKSLALSNTATENMGMEAFIYGLHLDRFFDQSEEEQEYQLSNIDAIELFVALQEANRELAMAKLENHFLVDFLEKNDPKLLVGLQQYRRRRESAYSGTGTRPQKDMGNGSMAGSQSGGVRLVKSSATRSIMSNTSTVAKKAHEYRLNYRAKADMADKTANDVEKQLREMERAAAHNVKVLRGHIEEMRFMYEETQETIKIFQLHFLSSEKDLRFLNIATEKQLERKIKKFVNNWLKNARALLSTMRLRITALHEQCQRLRTELLTKSDLSGVLTAVDFEKLMIKRTELLNALDEKNAHMSGLKGVTGRAALSMSEEKQAMMIIEEESRQLQTKMIEVVKSIGKLDREAFMVERENNRDLQILEELKSQLERFEAPSVNDYIAKKTELLNLEKERKMLLRKVYILEMKLRNTQKKFKRRHSIMSNISRLSTITDTI